MTRHIKRGGKVWINVFPDKPVTEKPAETRMGSGKGNPERWVAVVKPGRILFELVVRRARPLAREAHRACHPEAADQGALRAAQRGGDRRCRRHTQSCASSTTTRVARPLAETKEELFNLRFQLVTGQLENYVAPRSDVAARTSPASTPCCRAARDRGRRERRQRCDEADDGRGDGSPSARTAKVREGSSCRAMDKTVVVSVDRARPASPLRQDACSARRSCTCTTRQNDLQVGDRRAGRGDPAAVEAEALARSSKCWSGPE